MNGLDRTHANDISVRTKGRPSTLDHSIFSTRGTKEYAECSNRGLCNYVTGVCECFGGYSSSDGLGNFGNIADCGYQNSDTFNYTVNGTTIITSCPYKDGLICSGNGVCNEGTGKCTCIDGYGERLQFFHVI